MAKLLASAQGRNEGALPDAVERRRNNRAGAEPRRLRLERDRRRARCGRLRRTRCAPDPAAMRRPRRALPARTELSQQHRHGAARLRQGRIPLFQISAAGARRRAARQALREGGATGQCLEWAAQRCHALSGTPRRLSETLPPGRAGTADAAPAALRPRRLQLFTPGPLWQTPRAISAVANSC